MRGSFVLALVLAVILALAGSLFVGASSQPPSAIIQAALAGDFRNQVLETVLYIRLPRGVLAALVGAALAVAGAIMQLVTRNPLASPQTLGINATAALAMVGYIVLGVNIGGTGAIPAFLGAFYRWHCSNNLQHCYCTWPSGVGIGGNGGSFVVHRADSGISDIKRTCC